jgi:hypothetical protein
MPAGLPDEMRLRIFDDILGQGERTSLSAFLSSRAIPSLKPAFGHYLAR